MPRPQNDYSKEAFDAAGLALGQIGRAMEGFRDLAVDVIGLSIRGPRSQGDEFFVTVRGLDADGQRWVAFHSAFTLTDLIRGVDARLSNGTLKWREDQFER